MFIYNILFPLLATIIQFTFIQHSILSLFFHQTLIQINMFIYNTLFPLLTTIIQFTSFDKTYSLSFSLFFHQALIQIDMLIYKTLFPLLTIIIQFTFIQHNIRSLFFHQTHSNRYTYLQDSISTFSNYY